MFRFDCDVSQQGVGDQPRPPRSVIPRFCELLLFEHVAAPAIYWSAQSDAHPGVDSVGQDARTR